MKKILFLKKYFKKNIKIYNLNIIKTLIKEKKKKNKIKKKEKTEI